MCHDSPEARFAARIEDPADASDAGAANGRNFEYLRHQLDIIGQGFGEIAVFRKIGRGTFVLQLGDALLDMLRYTHPQVADAEWLADFLLDKSAEVPLGRIGSAHDLTQYPPERH